VDATTAEMANLVVRTIAVVKTIILQITVNGNPVPRDPSQNRQQNFARGPGSGTVLQKKLR